MLVSAYAGGIVEGNPSVDELIWYDGPEGMIPFGAMLRTIRARKFEACLVVHPTWRLAWLMVLSGIPLRVGTGYRLYSFLFNERVYTHRKSAERHEVEYNLELAQQIGCSVPAGFVPEFTIVIPEEARKRVDEILRSQGIETGDRVVVIHPGSGGSAREWPLDHFAGLAAHLAGVPGVRVTVTGARRSLTVRRP
jgi:heptosyltransferase-3